MCHVNAWVPYGSILGPNLLFYVHKLTIFLSMLFSILLWYHSQLLVSSVIGFWFMSTGHAGFLIWIWPTRCCGMGLIQYWKNVITHIPVVLLIKQTIIQNQSQILNVTFKEIANSLSHNLRRFSLHGKAMFHSWDIRFHQLRKLWCHEEYYQTR